jgi:Tol biopolymer transport system component/DNA-binding winged helix-turn-helix (wHTH) protein
MAVHDRSGIPHPTAMAPFRVENHLVQPALNRIVHGEEVSQLEPRTMYVLVCLANRPGQVVTREELLDTVWPNATVCEDALTRTISDLRRVLGDDSRNPRFIETIRKAGYRLIAPVQLVVEIPARIPIATAAGTNLEEVEPVETPFVRTRATPTARGLRSKDIWRWSIGAITVLVLAVTIGAGLRGAYLRSGSTAMLHGIPFTTYPGKERYPAISPDGTRVAFAWDGGHGTGRDIYVKQRNTESPLRLTDHPEDEDFPAWSPDGTTVAFIRRGAEGGLHTVAAIGGAARRVGSPKTASVGMESEGLDWSPDGRWLACVGHIGGDTAPRVLVISPETFEVRAITSPPDMSRGDQTPAFSPDGAWIAFARRDAVFQEDVYLISSDGKGERRLTTGQGRIVGLDWMPDGESLIISTSRSHDYQLWQLHIGDGSLTWMPTRGDRVTRPSVARNGRTLVYENQPVSGNIYRLPSPLETATEKLEPAPLILSTRLDTEPTYSPDGSRIAFQSTRTGHPEIWICDANGANPRCLTSFEGSPLYNPCWSPDGRRIVVSVLADSLFTAHVIDLAGGPPRRIRESDHHQIVRFWSQDGRWVYFEANTEDGWRFCRVCQDGCQEEDCSPENVGLLYEAPGGELLYMVDRDSGHVYSRTTQGDTKLLHHPPDYIWDQLVPVEKGFYFTRYLDPFTLSLGFYDPATGSIDSLYRFDRFAADRISVSPVDGSIVYTRYGSKCDLVLVEDFL